MRFHKNAPLIITLLFSSPLHAKECNSQLIDWSDYDKTLVALKNAYHNENYSSVENSLRCLMGSNKAFTSGKPGSVATYWFFRNEMHAPGANETDEMRIKKWKNAITNSPYAHFAELRLMYSQAWNARGTKYANETSEEQFKRFKEKLLLAESAILSEQNQLKDTAISYNLLMAVTLDTRDTKTSSIKVFEEGVAKWPNYYDFYEVFLTRLVPKWGGSWEEVDAFINYWSEKLKEQENDSLYARLYYSIHKHEQISPHGTRVDWEKLKPSLVNLYTKYPVNTHYEIAASYACYFSDYDFYKQLIDTYKIRTSEAWLIGSSIEECNAYFISLPQNSEDTIRNSFN